MGTALLHQGNFAYPKGDYSCDKMYTEKDSFPLSSECLQSKILLSSYKEINGLAASSCSGVCSLRLPV